MTSEVEPGDLVERLMAMLDSALDTVFDRVVRPLLIVGRFVAFGFVVVLAAIVLFIAALVGMIRLLDVYAFHSHVWITYYALAALFLSAGLLIWRKRRPAPSRP